MDLKEAKAWMSGERSTINHHLGITPNRGEDLVNCAREDAAFTEQAYWVLRAHHEGLMEPEQEVDAMKKLIKLGVQIDGEELWVEVPELTDASTRVTVERVKAALVEMVERDAAK